MQHRDPEPLACAALAAIGLLVLFLAAAAHAQTPEDVSLKRVGGLYEIIAEWPPEPDAVSICCARVDVEPALDFGCVITRETYVDAEGLNHTVAILTTAILRTIRNDAVVRCTATDLDGNVSDPSLNAGIADFTPPSPPVPLPRRKDR